MRETRPKTCFNPPVLSDGTVNLKIGANYKQFWRIGDLTTDFVSNTRILLLLSYKTENVPNPYMIKNLIEFTFLINGKIEKFRFGSDSDSIRFYFEEIKDEINNE